MPRTGMAVVGNGPLSEGNRVAIARRAEVVRFNDARSWRPGERTTQLVVRHPSAFPPPVGCCAGVALWHVGVDATDNATLVYERGYGARNAADATARLFPNCTSCPWCYHNRTYAGPSTGAVVLSVLQSRADVRRMDVFGMNWNGDAQMHVDFAVRSLVRRCCTKCVVHPTSSEAYSESVATLAGASLALSSTTLVLLAVAVKRVVASWR